MATKRTSPFDPFFGMPKSKAKPAAKTDKALGSKSSSAKRGERAGKGTGAIKGPGPFEQVYAIVVKIPRGRVLTYGAISILINRRLSAAAVGWAMRALPEDETRTKNGSPYHSKSVPWHRVINSKGGISTTNEPGIPRDLQQTLLEAEGVRFNDQGLIDLDKYLWKP